MRLYEAGCTRDEVFESQLRHLLMRHRAYEKRCRRQEAQILGLRSEVRAFMGGDPIDPDEMYGGSTATQNTDASDQARMTALKQMDMDDTEEMAPEDMPVTN